MVKRIKGYEATKIYRGIQAKIYWCTDKGVPALSKEICSSYRELKLVPPGDARPAYPHDVENLSEGIKYDLGEYFVKYFSPQNNIILLNKVQGIDVSDEVIVNGYTIGFRFYDIYSSKWRFRPTYYGVSFIIHNKIGPYIILDSGKLEPFGFIDLSSEKIVSKNVYGEWISIATKDNRYHGIGKLLKETNKIRILKVWKGLETPELLGKSATLQDAIKYNKEYLLKLEEESILFIKSLLSKGYRLIITISGGKDSTAAASIASKAGVKEAVFNDTGIEHPETIETVDKLVDKLSLKVDIIDSGDAFWKNLPIYGPPARDYRWCTTVIKLVYINKYFREKNLYGIVASVTGQRKYESTQRALAGKLSRAGTGTPFNYLASPVYDWTSLAIHMYIHLEKLPLHSLYRLGFDRIGCYLCPTSRIAEFNIVKKLHPDLWSKWENWLENYRRIHRLPRIWIDKALWRWRYSYPPEIKRFLREKGYNPRHVLEKPILYNANVEPSIRVGRGIIKTIRLNNVEQIVLPKLKILAKILNINVVEEQENYLVLEKEGVRIKITSNAVIECRAPTEKKMKNILSKILKLVYLITKCTYCNLCKIVCYSNIVLPELKTIHGSPRNFSRCLNICPISANLSKDPIYLMNKY